MSEWVRIVVSILSGLAVCIPLVVKLVNTVIDAVKGKNWNVVVSMAAKYMVEAEKLFKDGATRKEWVMAMVKAGAETINFNMSAGELEKVSALVDELCAMAKTVNV